MMLGYLRTVNQWWPNSMPQLGETACKESRMWQYMIFYYYNQIIYNIYYKQIAFASWTFFILSMIRQKVSLWGLLIYMEHCDITSKNFYKFVALLTEMYLKICIQSIIIKLNTLKPKCDLGLYIKSKLKNTTDFFFF